MGVNFDVNRGLENTKTKKITTRSVILIVILILVILSIVVIQTIQGKNVKTPLIETNIPQEGKSDTVKNKTNNTEINIEENKGDIIFNQ